MKLTRRDKLKLLAAMAVACRVGDAAARSRTLGDRAQDGGRGNLLRVFDRPESAEVVGRRYLQQNPREADFNHLFSSIVARIQREIPAGSTTDLARLPRGQLRKYVRAAVSRDFGEGRVTNLDGWILAETESRLCALQAMQKL